MRVPIPPHPRRTLGQNFLCDENILKKLVLFCGPSPNDTFLEIGAGTGALTALLAPKVRRLIAVEIDDTLLPFLESIPRIEILTKDIRKLRLSAIANGEKLRIVGNLPYYLSTTILNSLIAQRDFIRDMVLLFQQEVASRITAAPSHSDYSLLSVLAQYFCQIEKGFRISRSCFIPKPDVESRVLRFRFRTRTLIEYESFFGLLSVAFSQRRKMLRNNLLRETALTPDQIDRIFGKMNISESVRAENLTPEQFERLMMEIKREIPNPKFQ